MGTGRCSLIDGTGHGRCGGTEEGKKEERKGKASGEMRGRQGEVGKKESGRTDRGSMEQGQPPDHHRLIYNAGGNRIHDQNPAFRGIDGSPCAQRAPATLVFSNEPAPFSSSRCLPRVQRGREMGTGG